MRHSGSLASLATLPAWLLIALGVVLVIEVALDVVALIDLYRRPLSRVALGNKWAWVAIIILVNLLGAILYLAVGRRPAPPSERVAPVVSARDRTSIADALYGDGGGGGGGERDSGQR